LSSVERMSFGGGLDLLLVLAVDLDEVLGNRVAPLLAFVHETDSRLQTVELFQQIH